MREQKKIILISNNKDLFASLERVFHFIDGIECIHAPVCPKNVEKDNVVLLDAIGDEKNLSEIINLRLRMNLCPIIVLTFHKSNKKSPPKKFETYEDTAITPYQVPFNLNELRQSVKYTYAIPKEESVNELVIWLSDASSYIDHQLRKPEGRVIIEAFLDNILTSLREFLNSTSQDEIAEIKAELIEPIVNTTDITNRIVALFNKIKGIITENARQKI